MGPRDDQAAHGAYERAGDHLAGDAAPLILDQRCGRLRVGGNDHGSANGNGDQAGDDGERSGDLALRYPGDHPGHYGDDHRC